MEFFWQTKYRFVEFIGEKLDNDNREPFPQMQVFDYRFILSNFRSSPDR